MNRLKIPASIFRQMLEHSNAQLPFEACGILAGSRGRVEKFYPMTNADRSPAHFMMEPREQFAAAKDIRLRGLEMLAIYHSHPDSPAGLSAEDIRLALTPDVTYLVLSLGTPDSPVLKGFKLRDSRVIEVPVEIVRD